MQTCIRSTHDCGHAAGRCGLRGQRTLVRRVSVVGAAFACGTATMCCAMSSLGSTSIRRSGSSRSRIGSPGLFEWLGYELDLDCSNSVTSRAGSPTCWSGRCLVGGIFFKGHSRLGDFPHTVGHRGSGRDHLVTTSPAGGWRWSPVGVFSIWPFSRSGQPSMETFALVIITVPFAALSGLVLGILAVRHKRVRHGPHADFRCHAKHPGVCLFGAGDRAVWVRSGAGHDRDRHIRHAADGRAV